MVPHLNALLGARKLLLGNRGYILVIDEALEIIPNAHSGLRDNAYTNPVRQAYGPEGLNKSKRTRCKAQVHLNTVVRMIIPITRIIILYL